MLLKSLREIEKQTLLDMASILAWIISDLQVVIQIQNNYMTRHRSVDDFPEKNISPEDYHHVTFSYLFLTLAKLIEFCDQYKDKLNKVCTEVKLKEISNKLKRLDIRNFRNIFIGHIRNSKTKKPITHDEFEAFFKKIESEHKSFYAFWLKLDSYNFSGNMPLLESLQKALDLIKEEYLKI